MTKSCLHWSYTRHGANVSFEVCYILQPVVATICYSDVIRLSYSSLEQSLMRTFNSYTVCLFGHFLTRAGDDGARTCTDYFVFQQAMSVSLEVIVTEHLTRVNDLQPQLFGTLIVHYIIVRYNHNCHHIIVHHVVRYLTTHEIIQLSERNPASGTAPNVGSMVFSMLSKKTRHLCVPF